MYGRKKRNEHYFEYAKAHADNTQVLAKAVTKYSEKSARKNQLGLP